MRILSIRQGHEAEDLAAARATILAEIGHPRKIVMLIRGSGSEVARFADSANGRAMDFPWRSVIWVQDGTILDDRQHGLFGDGSTCAVVLDRDDQPAARLQADATLLAIDQAFRRAEAGGGL